jgi:hypothetical protein
VKDGKDEFFAAKERESTLIEEDSRNEQEETEGTEG